MARKTHYVADGITYFMGAPCPRGHDGMRYVSKGSCVHCHTARNRGEFKDDALLTYVMLADWRVVMP